MEFREFRNRTTREPNTSPYPPMELTPKEKDLLRQLATNLVAVNVEEFEEFLFDNNGVLPEHQWEFVRRDVQVETFLRRREKYGLRGFGATKRFRRETSDTSASVSSTKSDELTSLDVADIRSVGFKDGTIEDGVYGAMSPTTEVFRTKSAAKTSEFRVSIRVVPDGVSCTFAYCVLGFIPIDVLVGITAMVSNTTGET
ncbi:hypothetical protein PR002_g24700, partial [Phytophthora rubi]